MTSLSVVIPTMGRAGTLARVLTALKNQQSRPEFEVIVVADAREQELATLERLVHVSGVPARVLTAVRPGASAARNVGWRAAEGELVLFLGDDIVPCSTLLQQHLAHHRARPQATVGVLGHVRWASELTVTPFMRWLERGIQFDYPSIVGDQAGWGRLYTANVSVKRGMLERVSGFDEERLPFLYEDLDLGYRMSHHGFELLYNRDAVGEHLHAVDLKSWRERARQLAIAERQFVGLHPEIPPYFFRLFSTAVQRPPARGRGALLLRFGEPDTPLIGKRAWTSADLHFRQELAPAFLASWESSGPDENPSGSSPGGPK